MRAPILVLLLFMNLLSSAQADTLSINKLAESIDIDSALTTYVYYNPIFEKNGDKYQITGKVEILVNNRNGEIVRIKNKDESKYYVDAVAYYRNGKILKALVKHKVRGFHGADDQVIDCSLYFFNVAETQTEKAYGENCLSSGLLLSYYHDFIKYYPFPADSR